MINILRKRYCDQTWGEGAGKWKKTFHVGITTLKIKSAITVVWINRKEGNVLFNDTLNTFYLRLYGIGHMVKFHSDSERKPAAAIWATLSN